MPKLGESEFTPPHRRVLDRFKPDAAGIDRNTDVAARMAKRAEDALTPRDSRGRGKGSRKYAPPLTSDLHFRTMADLNQRSTDLAKYELPVVMRNVQRAWGAAYTQALYTDDTNDKQCAVMLDELRRLHTALMRAAAFYSDGDDSAFMVARKVASSGKTKTKTKTNGGKK